MPSTINPMGGGTLSFPDDGRTDTIATLSDTGGGGGGGFTPTYFQALKSGNQTSTTSWADITGWATPSHDTGSDYTFNTTTGVLTFDGAGDYLITLAVSTDQSGNNRVETGIRLMADTGGGFAALTGSEARNYISRNNTQDVGSVVLANFIWTAAATNEIKAQVLHVGAANDVMAGVTRLTVVKIG